MLSPDVPERLEESALGAASYGMEYRVPMLDVRLVEYCLSMPVHLKFRDGVGRGLIREAMRGLLPDQILDRDTKRFAMIPSSYQRDLQDRDAMRAMVRSWIANGDIGQYVRFDSNRDESDIEPPAIFPEITVKANFARRFAMFGIWRSRMTAKDGAQPRGEAMRSEEAHKP